MGHESFDRQEPLKTSSDRVFGLVFAVFFLIVCMYPLLKGGSMRWWAAGLSAAFLIAAMTVPRALAPLNRLWMRFGLVMHRIVNPILLGIMFFLVVTPIGLIMRALGKDPLRLRQDTGVETYWIPREPPGPPPDSLERQF